MYVCSFDVPLLYLLFEFTKLIYLNVLIMLIPLIKLAMLIRCLFGSLAFILSALIVLIVQTVLLVKDELYLCACIY
jgi:hypothetical protein